MSGGEGFLRVCVVGAELDGAGHIKRPPLLTDLAAQCRAIIQAAERDLGPIDKVRYLDLVADHLTRVPLKELRCALVIAGVGY